jgi:4-hydroxy 2-oxovalerate aldolase
MKVQILDCTLRDGGYVNDWDFSDTFGVALIKALAASGVDYAEIGFLDPAARGPQPWKNCTAGCVRKLKEHCDDRLKLALMINYGDNVATIPSARETGADMIRIATPKGKQREGAKLAAGLQTLGYETTVNFMGISAYSPAELLDLARVINEHKDRVAFFYLADSFGSLTPADTRRLFEFLSFATGARLGFHPHNNMQLAFANSLEAMAAGAAVVDGSVYGMGRGGGNLHLESFVAYLQTAGARDLDVLPLLSFADLFMAAMREKYEWGYSLSQLLSGTLSCHPNYPSNLLALRSHTAGEIYHVLSVLPPEKRFRFDQTTMQEALNAFFQDKLRTLATIEAEPPDVLRVSKKALLLCGGHSVHDHVAQLGEFIRHKGCVLMSVNNPQTPLAPDALFFGNTRRLMQYAPSMNGEVPVILGQAIDPYAEHYYELKRVFRLPMKELQNHPAVAFPNLLPRNSGIEAALTLIELGCEEIYIAGMDGYQPQPDQYYYAESDAPTETWQQLNAVIEEELAVVAKLAAAKGTHLAIITPTLFERYYEKVI